MLPDKLSELIRVALIDLEKCENDPRYFIDMQEWHHFIAGVFCQVCLAGAVAAQTIGIDIKDSLVVGVENRRDHQKLMALDGIRAGDYSWALERHAWALDRFCESPPALDLIDELCARDAVHGSTSLYDHASRGRALKERLSQIADILAAHGY